MSLEIRELSVTRSNRRVVRDVSLEVEAGRITVLLGANGAGKSSFVLGLAGRAATTGRVVLDERDIGGHRPNRVRRCGLAAVPEGHRVFAALSVLDNLRAAVLTPGHERRVLDSTFELFPELETISARRAGLLSGGQQQMVAVAQGLMSEPSYLLLDELSLGLAPVIVSRLIPTIRQIADRGVGVLLIEQHTQIALSVADHATVMSAGDLTWTGTPDDLARDPEILRRAYLGADTSSPTEPSRSSSNCDDDLDELPTLRTALIKEPS